MTFSIVDFASQTAKTIRSIAIGGEEYLHRAIASPITGGPIIGDQSLDAFSRIRVSLPRGLGDLYTQYQFDKNTMWDAPLFGLIPGSVSVDSNSVVLSTGSMDSGHGYAIQSREYFRYYTGNSQLAFISFLFGAAIHNVNRRIGLFVVDFWCYIGVYLEQNSDADVAFVFSDRDGLVLDRYTQGVWNVDKFDGSGPSGVVLDFSKVQVLVISYQWAGSIVLGFIVDGRIWTAHVSHNANLIRTTWTANNSCGVGASISNTSGASSIGTLHLICASVFSEGVGKRVPNGDIYSYGNTALKAASTRIPIVGIMAGPADVQFIVRPIKWEPFVQSGDGYFELMHFPVNNYPTTPSVASWTADFTESIVERDVSATTLPAPGIVIDACYQSADKNGRERRILRKLRLGAGDQLYVVASAVGGVSVDAGASIKWEEEK